MLRQVDAVEEQHVQVDIQVWRTTEALNQGHRFGTSRVAGLLGPVNLAGLDSPLDDAGHTGQNRRPASKQELELTREACLCGE